MSRLLIIALVLFTQVTEARPKSIFRIETVKSEKTASPVVLVILGTILSIICITSLIYESTKKQCKYLTILSNCDTSTNSNVKNKYY